MAGDEDLDLDGDASEASAPKKASGLAALLPNLLKFVAIGLGALVFIVTVSVITFNILNKGGQSQTVIPTNSPFVGARQTYQFYSSLGAIRTSTRDPLPYSVVVDMVIGYDMNDNVAQTELIGRSFELRDFVRLFFKGKLADELRPENEPRLKQEILEYLNTKILNSARARIILFNQLDVMSMQ
jgi:flagellar FliL protein